MKVLSFVGKMKDFRMWLAELQPKADNIICLNDWKKKKAAKVAASKNQLDPSIA